MNAKRRPYNMTLVRSWKHGAFATIDGREEHFRSYEELRDELLRRRELGQRAYVSEVQ